MNDELLPVDGYLTWVLAYFLPFSKEVPVAPSKLRLVEKSTLQIIIITLVLHVMAYVL